MVPILLMWSGVGIALLRAVFAAVLIGHGLPKLKDIKGTAGWLGPLGFRPARFWAIFIAVFEVFGGALVLVGLFTQVIAFIAAIEFVVIIMKVTWKRGFVKGYDIDLLMLAASLALLTLGSGAWSIDRAIHLVLY